jgi:hypothetical protein
VALVCAEVSDDLVGAGAILRNGDHRLMVITLAKLLAEVADQLDLSPAWFRGWAAQAAVNRP